MQTCTRNFHEIEPKMCFLTGPWMLVAAHQGSVLPSAPQGRGDEQLSSSFTPKKQQKLGCGAPLGQPTKLHIAPPT